MIVVKIRERLGDGRCRFCGKTDVRYNEERRVRNEERKVGDKEYLCCFCVKKAATKYCFLVISFICKIKWENQWKVPILNENQTVSERE